MANRPIQVVPRGLLGFFQLKNAGENPVELGSMLSPTIESRDWYFSSRAEPLIGGSSILVPNASTNLVLSGSSVPANEHWWIERIMIRAILIAGETLTAAIGSTMESGLEYLLSETLTAPAGPSGFRLQADRPFFAPSGTTFGVAVSQATTAGNITVVLTMRGTKLTPV